jgi:hypothetical protein
MRCHFINSSVIKGYILLLFILGIVPAISAQTTAPTTVNKALQEFQIIEQQNRFVENFLDIKSSEQNAYNLPVGIKKIIGNIPLTLAINNVKFFNNYGEITLMVKMDIPQKSKSLVFAADGVRLSSEGDLIGDVKLSLLSDVPISLGKAGTLVLKGSMDTKTGAANSKTYVSVECNGDFKELFLDGECVLSDSLCHLAGKPDSAVVAPFRTIVSDWNDIFLELSFPAFEINGYEGFELTIDQATLDFSDTKNSPVFAPPAGYLTDYYSLPDPLLWRGLYIQRVSLAMPEWFKNENSKEKTVIEASRFLIDELGITGDIIGENIIPLSSGNASGWPISVTDFQLSFLTNHITGFGFGGQIKVPLSEKVQALDYKAFISKDEYLFSAALPDTLDFDMFGSAQLHLTEGSYLEMALKNKQFRPKVVLNGYMSLDQMGLQMEQIVFHKLAISTESPVFSVEAIEYGGEVKLNNFPISISDIRFQSVNDRMDLSMDVKLNLMEGKIAAGTHIHLLSEYQNRKWAFKGVSLDAIMLDNVQMAGFNLSGEIRTEKNHPVYGNYFGGEINAVFDALSNGVKVKVDAVFGNKDFRYWYVEGKANFSTGVPIGPVSLNGFTGGAYYRMSATGKEGLEAYAPNKDCSLGVKAGIGYYIGSKTAVHGEALFEMNFLSGGGIKNIHFYGTAEFMSPLDGSKFAAFETTYKKVQANMKDLSQSLTVNLPPALSGSDVSQKLLPDVKFTMGVNAYVMMDYDFQTKTFDATCKVMINTPGGFLRGAGNNNEAGWAHIHCSPQSWYVHIGTPTNPIGVKLGLGSFSLKSESYFMLGDRLEPALPPPAEVLNILRISSTQADYMKYPDNMKLGRGIAFGSRFGFDTGNLSFLILYARFATYDGFDFMLTDMSNYACEGSSSPVGINGWYANGQCYLSLSGELGAQIKLWFIKKRITIIKGAAAALLQARGPNPTWIGGYMGLQLNILGGLIKGSLKMKFSFGNDCKLVALNGDNSPLDMPLIADLTPIDKDTDVDIFVSPQVTFNMPIGESFDAEDEKGNVKSYRIKLEDFYIMDNKNQKVAGTIKWNKKYDAATFESKDVLPPYNDMKVFVSVNFEEYSNGKWSVVSQNGTIARESREVSFKTGEAPNYIPLTNINYCYPVVGQKNFFKGESDAGYIQLFKGQPYLFPDNFRYDVSFTAKTGNLVKAGFKYNPSDARITYALPTTTNKTDYSLVFEASTAGQQETVEARTITNTLTGGDGESFTVDYMQQAAQQIVRDGSLEILKYNFRTSGYNTFEQKLSSLQWETKSRPINTDARSLLLSSSQGYEPFDEAELIGNDYTGNVPLISAEALMDNDYYVKDIAPLVYDWYPLNGIAITGREVSEYGVPPSKAFPMYDGYLDYISGNTYNDFMSKILPFVYELPYYYSRDYYELRTKAANSFDKGIDMRPLMPLLNSRFLFMRQGNYRTNFRYILPGGNSGTSRQMDYINTLDWR